MDLIIGSHVSFTKDKQLVGSVYESLSYGGNTFMIYTGAPQNTNRAVIDNEKTNEALLLMKEYNIHPDNIVAHAPYIINLANEDEEKHQFAVSFLKQEIRRCELLGINKLVVHPGNHVGAGIDKGIKNIINSLNEIISSTQKVFICLETMSGKGTECGSNFDELKMIIDGVHYQDKIKVCFDTCHLHDAGYDISDFDSILDEFDKKIGLSKLGCMHINDSKNEYGVRKDRHENIGLGYIGFNSLLKVIYNDRISEVPKILETPYVALSNDRNGVFYPPYKFEIKMIKEKKFNKTLLEDIINFYNK